MTRDILRYVRYFWKVKLAHITVTLISADMSAACEPRREMTITAVALVCRIYLPNQSPTSPHPPPLFLLKVKLPLPLLTPFSSPLKHVIKPLCRCPLPVSQGVVTNCGNVVQGAPAALIDSLLWSNSVKWVACYSGLPGLLSWCECCKVLQSAAKCCKVLKSVAELVRGVASCTHIAVHCCTHIGEEELAVFTSTL